MKLKIITLPNKIYKNKYMYFDAFKIHHNYIHLEFECLVDIHFMINNIFLKFITRKEDININHARKIIMKTFNEYLGLNLLCYKYKLNKIIRTSNINF